MKIDENGKINGKVSIIDIFAIAIVLVAVIGISLRFVALQIKEAKEGKKAVTLSYVVEIEGVRHYTVDALEKRGDVIDISQKKVLGKVVDVKSKNQKVEQFLNDGTIVDSEIPDKYVAHVTILSDAVESNKGYYLKNDSELSVGANISIATKYVNSSGRVISIKKVGDGEQEENKVRAD